MDTVHTLGERGIAFRSLTEGFDTTTARATKFLFGIVAAIAQMERRMIVERTHSRPRSRPTPMP
ncbi:recombinase family protein [Rhodococcus erythropolis]|nr:recombinase family protein [Rhodococcus erythropolis]